MSTQDQAKLKELLEKRANNVPCSASAVVMYNAEIEELQSRIAKNRLQKEAEQARHNKALEVYSENQIALLQKQLEEEKQANTELRQANASIKSIAEDTKREARSATVLAWISVMIGIVSIGVAVILRLYKG